MECAYKRMGKMFITVCYPLWRQAKYRFGVVVGATPQEFNALVSQAVVVSYRPATPIRRSGCSPAEPYPSDEGKQNLV